MKGIVGEKHDRRLEFNRDDFEVLDIALKEVPELRLCAGVLRAAREAKIEYPITSVKQLIKLLPEQQMYIEGHWLRPVLIERYMRQEYLPIENEQDLVARCHLALIRCREDVRWAVHAPPYAAELLAELPAIPKTNGRA